MDASWNTRGACSVRESYLLILERYRPMGNQTRLAGMWDVQSLPLP